MFSFCLFYFWFFYFGLVWCGLVWCSLDFRFILMYSVEEISNLGGAGKMSRMNNPANNRDFNIKCNSFPFFIYHKRGLWRLFLDL